MPQVNAPQQQAAMEMQQQPTSSIVTQQPPSESRMTPDEDQTMSLRGGCTESCGCCGEGETCTFCCG